MNKLIGRTIFTIFIILFFLISLFLVQRAVKLYSKANSNNAVLYFSENNLQLKSTSEVFVYADLKNNNIAFMRFDILFDPSKVRLVNDPEMLLESKFNRTIRTTSASSSNINGRLSYIVALGPDKITQPVNETVLLLKLNFQKSVDYFETNVSIDNSTLQLVDNNSQIVAVDTKDMRIYNQPLATPTTTSTPTPIYIYLPTSTATSLSQTYTPIATFNSMMLQTITPLPTASSTINKNIELFNQTRTEDQERINSNKYPLVKTYLSKIKMPFAKEELGYLVIATTSDIFNTEVFNIALNNIFVKSCKKMPFCFYFIEKEETKRFNNVKIDVVNSDSLESIQSISLP